jgi:2-phosphoglycerate kinase
VKLVVNGAGVPYPDAVMRGKLRLCGLAPRDIESIMDVLSRQNETGFVNELQLMEQALSLVEKLKERNYLTKFKTVMRYYQARMTRADVPPIIVALEGASATGKSMLALEAVQDLAATRLLGTDTVRQVLRVIMSEKASPELYCHTYQAFTKRQSGPANLDPVVRGFLAQTDLIQPHVVEAVNRISREGADALVEGVHLIPGILGQAGLNVIEALINPPFELHQLMFLDKSRNSGLKTVTTKVDQREKEWQSARAIQEYLVGQAGMNGVPIIEMQDYQTAIKRIRQLVLSRMGSVLGEHRQK